MTDFTGKLVLVTGGARGIGRVVVRELARRGAHVLINYFHSREEAEQLAAELIGSGSRTSLLRASVAKRDQIAAMFERVRAEHGHLDVLINNAAAGGFHELDELTERDWARTINTNVLGTVWCSQHAVPLMRGRGGGVIVNFSSLGSTFVLDKYLMLGVSKAAVEALTRYLAVEYAPDNVRVNAASCSPVPGRATARFAEDGRIWQMLAAATPLGRLPSEEEYVKLVLFLASDDSSWITGQVLLADGGFSVGNHAVSSLEQVRPPSLTLVSGERRPAPAVTGVMPVAPAAADSAIAVVGVGIVVPGAADPRGFWDVLRAGKPMFSEPGDRFDVESIFATDPEAEDRSPIRLSGFIHQELDAEDLENGADHACAWLRRALRQSLTGVRRRTGDRHAVLVGYGSAGSQRMEESQIALGCAKRCAPRLSPEQAAVLDEVVRQHLRAAGTRPERYLPHVIVSEAMAGLVPADAELLTVDTACSSALYAVDLGMRALREDHCDVAVCGGLSVVTARDMVLFAKARTLSENGDVRAFDRRADGTLFSDAAGVVVLKTLDRARADGDRVLGILTGVGASSDGKGHAIYAPSKTGQHRALRRAFDTSGLQPDDIDLIIAHATGTRAGDATELAALRDVYGKNRDRLVVSNKSLVGHGAYAAGVISLIHALLALEHGTVPAQHRFDGPAPEYELESGSLRVPTADTPLPRRDDRPRNVAISAFGFGGTNMHVIVSGPEAADRHIPPAPTGVPDQHDPIVIVDWSVDLPGEWEREQVARWLTGGGENPARGFGDHPATPPVTRIRIPPPQLRAIDRSQIMALRCTLTLTERLGPAWERLRDKTGVFGANTGPTRMATLYGLRIRLADLENHVVSAAGKQYAENWRRAFAAFAQEVRDLIPPSSEDSEPGLLGNIISGRVANYFDLHGPNMLLDTGADSTFSALRAAASYLGSGDVDLALVLGCNGNSTPEMRSAAGDGIELAEGAVVLAVTRRSVAEREGFAVLATVDPRPDSTAAQNGTDLSALTVPGRSYLAADSALAILRTVLTGRSCTIRHTDPLTGRRSAVGVTSARTESPATDPDADTALAEYGVIWVPCPTDASSSASPLAFPEECLIVTDDPGAVHALSLPEKTLVTAAPDLETLHAHVTAAGWRPRHVRVIVSCGPDREPGANGFAELLALNDAAFVAAKLVGDGLAEGGSYLVLLLDAFDIGVPRAATGLFTGFVKALAREHPRATAYAVLSSERDLREGLDQLAAEAGNRRLLPVAGYHCGRRLVPRLVRRDGVADGPLPIDRTSVVLAAGGSRGITAELLTALADEVAPKIWILGSNPLDDYPSRVLEGSDEEFAKGRVDYLRRRCAEGVSLAEAGREHARLRDARDACAVLDRLRARCGADRVRYLTCDLTDADAVDSAVQKILAEDPELHLVIYAAGISRTAALTNKTQETFSRVRDVKARGYANLRRALGKRRPRWLNMGSVIGFTGQVGETDYSAGNDFLASCATHAALARGESECTIGWTLWDSAGFAAKPITRAFMAGQGLSQGMSTAEGVARFLASLRRLRPEPVALHLGGTELRTFESWYPGLRASIGTAGRGRPFHLDREARRSATELVWERDLDLLRDGYLADHIVGGRPTLPGVCLIEAAVEAAAALRPHRVPTAVESASFQRFLRPHPSRGVTPFRITARLEATGDVDRVLVTVNSEVRSRGKVVTGRVHAEMTVLLTARRPSAPTWTPPSTEGWTDVPVGYYLAPPDAEFRLRGPFQSITDARVSGDQAAAVLVRSVCDGQEPFTGFVVPAVLLDAMLQVSVVRVVADGLLPLAVVASIGRIDLFTDHNDVRLHREENSKITLWAWARGGDDARFDGGGCRAITEDGRVLVEMRETTGLVTGHVDRGTGGYVPRPAGQGDGTSAGGVANAQL
ncbi:hypothetical protein GCM10022267_83510 [Lentzea roselyniae]|uniref:Uncharacterized protein n=1 Tax=Lentzea roselyniae TaxID=531940 RepID=A0ABP7CCG2_9PSEU